MSIMRYPKVTIVTPVYNGGNYIAKTIESVRDQTYQNIEYIIVDGGSTDNTLSIIESYRDCVSSVISELDEGMYDAVNKGLQKGSGEVFAYLNSDDVYFEDAVRVSVEKILQMGVDMSIGNCEYVDESGEVLYKYVAMPYSFDEVKRLGRIPFAQPSAFWTKKLYDQIGGFDSSLKYVADAKFFYEALKLMGCPPAYVDKYIVQFRLHDDGYTSKAEGEMRQEAMNALGKYKLDEVSLFNFEDLKVKWANRYNFSQKLIKRLLRYS